MERRLTAILAADVVGYSRLMGANETGTLAALKTLRTDFIDGKIAEHQGRIVKLTGDGMLVEFPSVVNAVACAAEVQRGMRDRNADVPQDRRIEFRIGVNLGDVIVEGEDIFGDGVNVAARLESIANPGGITISGSVRDHVGNRLDLAFEDMGEQTLKNIERPIRVYSVSLSSPAAWRVPRTARSLLAAGLTRTAPGRWVAARRLKLRISPRWSNPEPPGRLAARLACPLAIVHGDSDRFISASEADALYSSAAGPRCLHVVPRSIYEWLEERCLTVSEGSKEPWLRLSQRGGRRVHFGCS